MAKVEDCPGFETFGADVKAEPFKLWLAPVSYTHLDVYKRQLEHRVPPVQSVAKRI